MPFQLLEDIKPITDFAVSVVLLVALLFSIVLMYRLYQVCIRTLAFFNDFMFHRKALRETITQIERFCRKYANIDEPPEDASADRGSNTPMG